MAGKHFSQCSKQGKRHWGCREVIFKSFCVTFKNTETNWKQNGSSLELFGKMGKLFLSGAISSLIQSGAHLFDIQILLSVPRAILD